jgi:hypothetical protein
VTLEGALSLEHFRGLGSLLLQGFVFNQNFLLTSIFFVAVSLYQNFLFAHTFPFLGARGLVLLVLLICEIFEIFLWACVYFCVCIFVSVDAK